MDFDMYMHVDTEQIFTIALRGSRGVIRSKWEARLCMRWRSGTYVHVDDATMDLLFMNMPQSL
jgi:hypothetical protein